MLNNVLLSFVVGIAAGLLAAVFLVTLNALTLFRMAHPLLIWFMPVGGFVIGLLYWKFGRSVDSGNNLILDEIHEPQSIVPLRMIPLILVGTWVTHLFGGSAGREGTAVQMGAAAADQIATRFQRFAIDRTTLLMAGMSAGFGSVFGVPFAGAIFGLEVLAIGGLRARRILECTVASFAGHYTVLLLGVHHTAYAPPLLPQVNLQVVACVALSGVLFGLVAQVFSRSIHAVSRMFRAIPFSPLRPFIGGLIVVAGFYFVSWDRYAGLGIDVIEASLRHPLPREDWFWKSVFTVVTLGSGMKGGEVTPLLFIGATLGNFLATWLPIGFSLLAALGFVGVFAGAANTPLACTLMAMELFGPGIGSMALLSCYCAWLVSGHRGIYRSQRIARLKPIGRKLRWPPRR